MAKTTITIKNLTIKMYGAQGPAASAGVLPHILMSLLANAQVEPQCESCDTPCGEQPNVSNLDVAKLDQLLLDPNYELRTLKTLCEKLGVEPEQLADHVGNNDKYVIKRRRSDGAALIGLRNKAAVAAELMTSGANAEVAAAEVSGEQAESVRAEVAVASFEDELIALLDGEYDLRTTKTLATKLGKTEQEILDFANADSKYVIKRRRSDGAKLVGLRDRN